VSFSVMYVPPGSKEKVWANIDVERLMNNTNNEEE